MELAFSEYRMINLERVSPDNRFRTRLTQFGSAGVLRTARVTPGHRVRVEHNTLIYTGDNPDLNPTPERVTMVGGLIKY